MTEQLRKDLDYNIVMILVREMHEKGIITDGEYLLAEKYYTEKYNPVLRRLENKETRQNG
jgi:hypothetical protein